MERALPHSLPTLERPGFCAPSRLQVISSITIFPWHTRSPCPLTQLFHSYPLLQGQQSMPLCFNGWRMVLLILRMALYGKGWPIKLCRWEHGSLLLALVDALISRGSIRCKNEQEKIS